MISIPAIITLLLLLGLIVVNPMASIFALVGGYLGAHWVLLKGNLWVKRAFEIVTILTGLSLLWRGIS